MSEPKRDPMLEIGDGFELVPPNEVPTPNGDGCIDCYVQRGGKFCWARSWLNIDIRMLNRHSVAAIIERHPEVIAVRRKKVCASELKRDPIADYGYIDGHPVDVGEGYELVGLDEMINANYEYTYDGTKWHLSPDFGDRNSTPRYWITTCECSPMPRSAPLAFRRKKVCADKPPVSSEGLQTELTIPCSLCGKLISTPYCADCSGSTLPQPSPETSQKGVGAAPPFELGKLGKILWSHINGRFPETIGNIYIWEKIIEFERALSMPQQPPGEWISVEEALPKDKAYFWCIIERDGKTFACQEKYNKGPYWNCSSLEKVLYWLPQTVPPIPIQKPTREEEDEKYAREWLANCLSKPEIKDWWDSFEPEFQADILNAAKRQHAREHKDGGVK